MTPFFMKEHQEHLLLVDDEPTVLALGKLALEGCGYLVTAVTSVQDAMRVAAHESVDLIILDILMPNMDGLDLMDRVKKTQPRLPILLLTGMGFDDQAVQLALKKGANGYVSKGLPLSHLLSEVRRVVGPAWQEVKDQMVPARA
jgi:CheY-like chemotaxis protein